jgi:hypothetical protein
MEGKSKRTLIQKYYIIPRKFRTIILPVEPISTATYRHSSRVDHSCKRTTFPGHHCTQPRHTRALLCSSILSVCNAHRLFYRSWSDNHNPSFRQPTLALFPRPSNSCRFPKKGSLRNIHANESACSLTSVVGHTTLSSSLLLCPIQVSGC